MPSSSNRRRRSRQRFSKSLILWGATFIALIVAVVWTISVTSRNDSAPSASPAYVPPEPKPDLGVLELPPAGAKMTVFGDSWALGYSAKPDTRGFAYLTAEALGYTPNVLGASGTGYINDGPSGVGNYLHRMETLPADLDTQLLVLQGSLNDVTGRRQAYQNAKSTIELAHTKFPSATIIVVGPATDVLPVPPETERLARNLRQAASESDAYFISPVTRAWLNDENFAQYMDPETMHPNTEGHAYLAQQLADAIRQLAVAGQQ